jgi:hypothetical protein
VGGGCALSHDDRNLKGIFVVEIRAIPSMRGRKGISDWWGCPL